MRTTIVMCSSSSPRRRARRAEHRPVLAGGDWRRCKEGEIVEERWLGPRGGLLVGVNLTSSYGKASYENLRIAREGESWT